MTRLIEQGRRLSDAYEAGELRVLLERLKGGAA